MQSIVGSSAYQIDGLDRTEAKARRTFVLAVCNQAERERALKH